MLPGVTVTVTSVERGTTDSVVTNDSGLYIKDRLLPGTYEVRAELQGFKGARVSSVNVSVDTQTPVDFTLALGELSETVEVTGGSPLLSTDRADVATTFDTRQLTDLPVLDRNFTKFVLLTPGHAAAGLAARRQRKPAGLDADDGERAALQRHRPTSSTAPRTATRSSASSSSTRRWSRSAKRRSPRRTTTPSSARPPLASSRCRPSRAPTRCTAAPSSSSRATSSSRAIRSRSSHPDPLTGRFLPETKKNQFGGSIGGPIAKNRWFFFGDYEGTRSKVGGSRLATVPTDAARRGDFSAYGVAIFDPGHRRAGVAHAVCEQPDPAGPAVAAGAGRPAADSGAQRCRDARTARSTTTSRRDRRPSTRTPSTCASTDACATA